MLVQMDCIEFISWDLVSLH